LQSDDELKEEFNSVKGTSFSDCYVIPHIAVSKSLGRCYQFLHPHATVNTCSV